jgi:hypothetical protein
MSNPTKFKALEKIFKSFYDNILGFDYSIEITPVNTESLTWMSRKLIGEVNVTLNGTPNVDIYTHDFIEEYVNHMIDKVKRFIGISSKEVFNTKVVSINDNTFDELYLSKNFLDLLNQSYLKYKNVLEVSYGTMKIELIDNSFVFDSNGDTETERMEVIIESKKLKINNVFIDFDAFINKEEVIENTMNVINSIFLQYYDTEFHEDVNQFLDLLYNDHEDFWDDTDYRIIFELWLTKLGGYSVNIYNDSLEITKHLRGVMDAVYSYKESGEKTNLES